MNSSNSISNSTKFRRHPAKRILISDLVNGLWKEEEKILSTRYGDLKRVRICGNILNKKEVISETNEDSFLSDSFESNSRLSLQIDDGSGCLWATLWGIDANEYSHIKNGDLIDLVGILRFYRNNVAITAEFIHKVNSPNFETYHILEVLKKRKFDPQFNIEKSNSNNIDDFDFNPTDDIKSSEADIENLRENEKRKSNFNSSKKGKEKSSIFEEIDKHDEIVEYISNNDNGDGVSVEEISKKFSIEMKSLKILLDQLCQDVKIYKSQPGFYSSY